MKIIMILLLLMLVGCEAMRAEHKEERSLKHDCILVTPEFTMHCGASGGAVEKKEATEAAVKP